MIASYRIQLTPQFDFDAVRALLPYFQRLGISHLYLSPITEARRDSTHGYDVIDHNTIRQAFGGRDGFDRLLEDATASGLELILDFVPNHAGVGPRNEYWQDVLAYGPHSAYAHVFDIDWYPLKEELQEKVLLPFLGAPYGEVLDAGELQVSYEAGRFFATYFAQRFSLNPASYVVLLDAILPHFERQDTYFDLKDVRDAYVGLERPERQKSEGMRHRLTAIAEQLDLQPALACIDSAGMHDLLERQYWRLAYWKTAGFEINYRRFFDVNELVALRMEDPSVFWDAHQLLGQLLILAGIAGVRIDHIDGLANPHDYLERLRTLGARQVWVEKILASGETLPSGWPVSGDTGYRFLNDVMGVLLQPEGEGALSRLYERFVPNARSYEDEVYRSKILVIATVLSSELFRLTYMLDRLSEADYHTRDFTLEALREALAEIIAAFERYRTYLPYEEEQARELLQETVYRARQRNPATESSVYEFISRVILGDVNEDLREKQVAWTSRFQQYTAPVAAKGVEDTAFYRYLRLVALNEVGGEPDQFGTTPDAFHARSRYRAQHYPMNLLATATHDHKRGEDTRMRLIALAEEPDRWRKTLIALSKLAQPHRLPAGPTRFDEYLFYQTLITLWEPAFENPSHREALVDRLCAYMQKATRESKRRTSWINQDDQYEGALESFIRSVLSDKRLPDVLGDFPARIAQLGFANTLSQTLLKLTSPGIPDIYQGCELLDLSLVDPDNRHPVDFTRRQALLDELQPFQEAPEIDTLRRWIAARDERAKLFYITCLLHLRRRHSDLFLNGSYHALAAEDNFHFLSYARASEKDAMLVVVPRFPASFDAHRSSVIRLPDFLFNRFWTEVLTGLSLQIDERLDTAQLPLAWGVLVSAQEERANLL